MSVYQKTPISSKLKDEEKTGVNFANDLVVKENYKNINFKKSFSKIQINLLI